MGIHGPDGVICHMTVEEYVSGVHAGEERMLLRYRNATLRLI